MELDMKNWAWDTNSLRSETILREYVDCTVRLNPTQRKVCEYRRIHALP